MSTTIAGAFTARVEAEAAVDDLLAAGFESKDISLLVAESGRGQHFSIQEDDRGAEGAVGGGIAGGALGAIAATLATLGVIAAPIGLLAAGPIVAALAGAGAGGAAGGLLGGLVGMGIPEHHAKILDEKVRSGGILLAVNYGTDAQKETAQRVLNTAGAVETSTTVT